MDSVCQPRSLARSLRASDHLGSMNHFCHLSQNRAFVPPLRSLLRRMGLVLWVRAALVAVPPLLQLTAAPSGGCGEIQLAPSVRVINADAEATSICIPAVYGTAHTTVHLTLRCTGHGHQTLTVCPPRRLPQLLSMPAYRGMSLKFCHVKPHTHTHTHTHHIQYAVLTPYM
jgi:hypothetical protein